MMILVNTTFWETSFQILLRTGPSFLQLATTTRTVQTLGERSVLSHSLAGAIKRKKCQQPPTADRALDALTSSHDRVQLGTKERGWMMVCRFVLSEVNINRKYDSRWCTGWRAQIAALLFFLVVEICHHLLHSGAKPPPSFIKLGGCY